MSFCGVWPDAQDGATRNTSAKSSKHGVARSVPPFGRNAKQRLSVGSGVRELVQRESAWSHGKDEWLCVHRTARSVQRTVVRIEVGLVDCPMLRKKLTLVGIFVVTLLLMFLRHIGGFLVTSAKPLED